MNEFLKLYGLEIGVMIQDIVTSGITPITISPFSFSGAPSGVPIVTYDANTLYCGKLFAQGVASTTTIPKIAFYDENNLLGNINVASQAFFDIVASQTTWSSGNITVYQWFSRFVPTEIYNVDFFGLIIHY